MHGCKCVVSASVVMGKALERTAVAASILAFLANLAALVGADPIVPWSQGDGFKLGLLRGQIGSLRAPYVAGSRCDDAGNAVFALLIISALVGLAGIYAAASWINGVVRIKLVPIALLSVACLFATAGTLSWLACQHAFHRDVSNDVRLFAGFFVGVFACAGYGVSAVLIGCSNDFGYGVLQ